MESFQELKFLLFVGLFFILSGVASYGELRYRILGRTTEATITSVVEKDGSRTGNPKRTLEYRFVEESGTVRTETYDVAADFVVPAPDDGNSPSKITIQYVPGDEGASRPDGRSGWFAIAVFLALLGYFSYRVWCLVRTLRGRRQPKPPARPAGDKQKEVDAMSIPTIEVTELGGLAANGSIDLIDVRTPPEFETVHSQYAKLYPLDSLDPQSIAAQRSTPDDQPLYMICKMGGRSMKACEKFVAAGITNVVNVTGGTDAWVAAGLPAIHGERKVMALDRQMRILAGSIVLLGVVLSIWWQPAIWIAGFIGAGLVFSGVSNTCGMIAVLAKMPWNRPKAKCGSGG